MADYVEPTYAEVNKDVLRAMMETGPKYWATLGTSIAVAGICFFIPWFYQLEVGVGAAGMNRSAVWGTYLSNFIFWIGLSHSGTLLSAVLHITNSSWRKAIYRRSDDPYLADSRGAFCHGAFGPGLVCTLDHPGAEPNGFMAKFPVAADV